MVGGEIIIIMEISRTGPINMKEGVRNIVSITGKTMQNPRRITESIKIGKRLASQNVIRAFMKLLKQIP